MKTKSLNGVLGICNNRRPVSLMMASIRTLTTISRDPNSILAFQRVQRTINLRIAARDNMALQVHVSHRTIRRMPSKSVLTLTVMVRLTLVIYAMITEREFAAFDDQTSTFIIPSGAGFEVVFCPGARSTNILTTSKEQMQQLAQQGNVNHQAALSLKRARKEVFRRSAAAGTYRLDAFALIIALAVPMLAQVLLSM
jgi:hypothetical protein